MRTIERLSRERDLQVSHRINVEYEPGSAIKATTIRILIEALVNAATHAPGAPVAVVLSSDSSGLRLEVRNACSRARADTEHRPADSGYGLLGAAERAHILSGRLQAGVADDGDWVLSLTLPTTPIPAKVTL